jgi:hypothetical protein
LIPFLRNPPINHQLQPTAAATVTAAVAAADYVVRPNRNPQKEDNIVVAIFFACRVLFVIVNRSPASTMMGPHPSFSQGDGN